MTGNNYYKKNDTSSFYGYIYGLGSTTSTSSGSLLVGNRPRGRIPAPFRAMLTDPNVIYLAHGSVWVCQVSPAGEEAYRNIFRPKGLTTVGVASNVETRRIEYWASGTDDPVNCFRLTDDITSKPDALTRIPPEAGVKAVIREWAWKEERKNMPTAGSLTLSTSSYSYW